MVRQNKEIEGATNSLNKTIREIDAFLAGHSQEPTSSALRDELHGKLADLARAWYAKGFNRGHRECRAAFQDTGKVPKRLRTKVKRELFTAKKRKIVLKSKA